LVEGVLERDEIFAGLSMSRARLGIDSKTCASFTRDWKEGRLFCLLLINDQT
jgi:hypothetical protein